MIRFFTDKPGFAEQFLLQSPHWESVSLKSLDEDVRPLASDLFHRNRLCRAESPSPSFWQYLFLIEHAHRSQFDILVEHARAKSPLPHGICLVAGLGEHFHGYKNRRWVSVPGNIHLSAYVSPQQQVSHFGVGFTLLSVVSVLQTLDALTGLKQRAMVRWVNDILLGDAKVGGVLACTQSCGSVVAGAVLGIGLNVTTSPPVMSTPFVPEVGAVSDFLPEDQPAMLALTFERLLHHLELNYHALVAGDYHRLLETYRKRSLLIGREVKVFADIDRNSPEQLAHGRVSSIGEGLELLLGEGDVAVTKGRVVIDHHTQPLIQ
jgi:BirA family biotin operon repressor/biotin-[acetyl-CoA-carboxylase] ligase